MAQTDKASANWQGLRSWYALPQCPKSGSTPRWNRPGTYCVDQVTILRLPALDGNSYFPSQTFYPSSTIILSTGIEKDYRLPWTIKLTEQPGFTLHLHSLCFREGHKAANAARSMWPLHPAGRGRPSNDPQCSFLYPSSPPGARPAAADESL